MSELSEKQRRMPLHIAELVVWANQQPGVELAFGDAYRDVRIHGNIGVKKLYGHKNSCHKLRLAVDLILFIDGVYQTTTEAYAFLGEKWESIAPDCRWGGRFADGTHFSITYNGFK